MVEINFGGLTFGKKSIIKSIQQGSISLVDGNATTANINSVVDSNSILYMNGARGDWGASGATIRAFCYRISITNSTTVTAQKNTDESADMRIAFTVVEYYPGIIKSKQSYAVDINGWNSAAIFGTHAINAVNVSKSFINYRGAQIFLENNNYYTNNSAAERAFSSVELTNSTTVSLRINIAGGSGLNARIYHDVIEYY